MKTNRIELLDCLRKLQAGLANKENVEQSSCFVFTSGRIFTFNDMLAISMATDLEIDGAIGGQDLIALLSSVKEDKLEIQLEDDRIIFHAGAAEFGLAFQGEVTMPIEDIPKPGKKDWKELPDDFEEGVRMAALTVAKNSAKPILECVHFGDGYVESCDNFRITRYQLDEAFDDFSIPATYLMPIAQFNPGKYALTKNDAGEITWVHFSKDDLVMSTRVDEASYPTLDKILDNAGDGVKIKFPDDIGEAVAGARILSKANDTDLIKVMGTKKGLRIRGESASGYYEEVIPSKKSEKVPEFDVNPEALVKLVQISPKAVVSDGCMTLSTDKMTHMILLGR